MCRTRLEAANRLLREEGEIKKRLMTVEANRSLFEQLDRDMGAACGIADTPD